MIKNNNEITDRQKKILKIIGTIIALTIAFGLSISYITLIGIDFNNTKEDIRSVLSWCFTNFGSIAIGIFIKVLINKYHLKQVKEVVDTNTPLNKKQGKAPTKKQLEKQIKERQEQESKLIRKKTGY